MLYSVERIQEYIVPIKIHGVITRFMRDMVTQVKSNYSYRNNLAFTPWSINRNIIFKMKISKVTDYAALNWIKER